MKKFFAIALLTLIFALAACGTTDVEPDTPPDSGTAESEADATTPENDATTPETNAENDGEPTPATPATRGEMSDISSADFVMSIGPGWNLGNQFDAHQYHGLGFSWLGDGTYEGTSVAQLETAWVGGTDNVVTREFFEMINELGIEAIRIPVTWNKVAPGPDYQIREDWMARVYEVVGWAYDLNMHIVLNTHHENSFNTHDEIHGIGLMEEEVEHSVFILSTWWDQIARQFEPFGERLMFAGLNEPRARQGEWGGGIPETRHGLNLLNQAFVDTVRATGGNNERRFLLVPTHAASASDNAFNDFLIPEDTTEDRVILAVHTYSPFAWAHDGIGEYGGIDEIRPHLERVAGHGERLGVSVMLTEWGSINNGDDDSLAQREQHAFDYVTVARELGMATFWWDNNSPAAGTHGFGLFNRSNLQVHFPTIVDAIIRAYE
ncbi:MAG: cellulase family glycosylhydrolase [Defluviitaleaceae bacterium]|nr:cellulase family glycosylhydrolase [Defluviitaleaceae bacterium]